MDRCKRAVTRPATGGAVNVAEARKVLEDLKD